MSELSQRRARLLDLMPEGSAAIIHSGVSKISSEDEFYPFRVNSDFFYLTGISQENSVLMLVKGLGEGKSYLFIDPFSELKEKWTGKRIAIDEAAYISGLRNVLDNTVLESKIDLLLQKGSLHFGEIKTLYLDLVPELKIAEETSTRQYVARINELYPHIEVRNVHPFLISLRMVKSSYEVECIKEAINLTNHGINDLLMRLKGGIFEYQLASAFREYGFSNGKNGLAFSTIVAGGKNATCLHYPSQNERIREGDLVLFDLGYSYKGYSADISRTFPVSGKFSDLQKKIYDTVVLCNKAVIEYAKEGLTLKDLNDYAVEFYKAELPRRGLLAKDEDVRTVYYHSVSHHLGLDTHDAANRELPLQAGNVITVEPGLYFAKYGIGVRIEDDVLITKEGTEVLSRSIKKESTDVEQMISFRR